MAEVMSLIDVERKKLGISAENFAHSAGVTVTTYSRHVNGRQKLGLEALQGYAKQAKALKNNDILRALGAYALGLSPEDIIINQSQ